MTATPTVITQQDPSAVSTAPAGNVAFVSSKGNRTDTMAGATEQERQHTDWKDILRAALRQTHSKENLSTLLFLLDSLTYLRTLPTPQDDSTAGGQPDGKAEDISQFYGYLKALVSLIYVHLTIAWNSQLMPLSSNHSINRCRSNAPQC